MIHLFNSDKSDKIIQVGSNNLLCEVPEEVDAQRQAGWLAARSRWRCDREG